MDYEFREAQKMLNKVLKDSYQLRHPEKITYIDKIILWLRNETDIEYEIAEEEDGISVSDKNSGKCLYFFRNPEIKMD